MNSLQRVRNCSNLSISTKVHLYQVLVMSVLLYGAEKWTLLIADLNTQRVQIVTFISRHHITWHMRVALVQCQCSRVLNDDIFTHSAVTSLHCRQTYSVGQSVCHVGGLWHLQSCLVRDSCTSNINIHRYMHAHLPSVVNTRVRTSAWNEFNTLYFCQWASSFFYIQDGPEEIAQNLLAITLQPWIIDSRIFHHNIMFKNWSVVREKGQFDDCNFVFSSW